jgi:hypothetical protein
MSGCKHLLCVFLLVIRKDLVNALSSKVYYYRTLISPLAGQILNPLANPSYEFSAATRLSIDI